MVHIGLRLGPGGQHVPATFNHDIIAWGDSLTAGAGMAEGLAYPAQAASLFVDGRHVTSKGIGGQTAEQIAARQGGLPIQVTFAGNAIGAKGLPIQSWTFDFGTTVGWTKIGSSGVFENTANALRRSGVTDNLGGMAVTLGKTVPAGHTMTAAFDLTEYSGGSNNVKIKLGPTNNAGSAGTWQGAESVTVDAAGHHGVSHSVSGAAAVAYAFRYNGTPATAASFAIENLTINEHAPYSADSISEKNVNVLQEGGAYSGSISGTIGEVHGTMVTDMGGNWSFSRTTDGEAVTCPAGSLFIPDDAGALRPRIAWIWAGNNGITADPGSVTSTRAHIAAMVAYLQHRRFLIAGILTRSSDIEDVKTLRLSLNAQLSARYGPRYVDLLAKLQNAHDGSEGDLADIANRLVPRSLRIDTVHLTAAGYALVAEAMHAATVARGW